MSTFKSCFTQSTDSRQKDIEELRRQQFVTVENLKQKRSLLHTIAARHCEVSDEVNSLEKQVEMLTNLIDLKEGRVESSVASTKEGRVESSVASYTEGQVDDTPCQMDLQYFRTVGYKTKR